MKKGKIYPHELIGKTVEVIEAKNSSVLGLKGKIVDESKSTLTLESQGKRRRLLKNTFALKLSNGEIIVAGSLSKKPEERIKG